MSVQAFFETEPLYEIVSCNRVETPMDAVAFVGNPRKHPYDDEKFILFEDPLGKRSAILEFRLRDIVSAESMPAPVTVSGSGIKLVKVWIRKGCFGMRYLPFEVADPPRYFEDSKSLRDKIAQSCS